MSVSVNVTSSETQGLLAGTMRYFRASDFFGRKFTLSAEEPLGTYSYRTSSRSGRIPFRRLDRKIFFRPIREELWQGNSVAFLHKAVFFIDRRTFLLGPYNVTGRLSWRALEKKCSTKPRKSQALIMGLGTNTLPSIFRTDLSKVYRKFL